MKNILQFFGLAALAAVIGFTLTACKNEPSARKCPPHKWNEYTQTTAPTCTEDGIMTRTCKICSITDTVTEPGETATGHQWEYAPGANEPTCTTPGSGERHCKNCPETSLGGNYPALGHLIIENDYEITIHPTCIVKGEEEAVCARIGCDAVIKREIPIDEDGHDWKQLTGTPSTCSTHGSGTRKCELCNKEETSANLDFDENAHDWNEYIVTIDPTCTATGRITRTCKLNSQHTETHSVAMLAHNYSEWTQTTAPTCMAKGEETEKCRGCSILGTNKRDIAIDPTAHDWNVWAQTLAPTCSAVGEDTRMCKLNTAHTETRDIAIDPGAHDMEWKLTTNPTNITTGVETNTCKFCAYTAGTRTSPSTPITSLDEYNAALSAIRSGGNNGNYFLNLSGTINIIEPLSAAPTASTGFGTATDITVTLTGSGTLSTAAAGSIFRLGSGQTLVINSKDLTLLGNENNTFALVYAQNGAAMELKNGTITGNTSSSNVNINSGSGVFTAGTFIMEGGEISGNTAEFGGGVFINTNGSFTMNGGEISGNTVVDSGGGVYVMNNAGFTMNAGKISNNTASNGGGGGVFLNGTFTMKDGEINGNTSGNGGGVYITNTGILTMSGGEISGNIANGSNGGGGLWIGGSLTMTGGKIIGNNANDRGGGLFVGSTGILTMSGGEISGNTANGVNGGGGVFVNTNTAGVTGALNKIGGIIYGNNALNETDKNIHTGGNRHAVGFYNGANYFYRGTTLGVNDNISTAALPANPGDTLNNWTME